MEQCPCGSGLNYTECCGAVIAGNRNARTAEELMRARYSAYAKGEIDFIYNSTHPEKRSDFDREGTVNWSKNSEWLKIEILSTTGGTENDTEGEVEFVASFKYNGVAQKHHELAKFSKTGETWYFDDGKPVNAKPLKAPDRPGRNDPCSCGSGKKYKKCCGA